MKLSPTCAAICLLLALSCCCSLFAQTTEDNMDVDYESMLPFDDNDGSGNDDDGGGDDGGSGGSGNGADMCSEESGECLLTPAPVIPDLIENCTLPDDQESSGSNDMEAALNQGICHSLCFQYMDNDINSDDKSSFIGFPLWTLGYSSFFFSEDGRRGLNCLLKDNPYNCQLPTPDECDENLTPLFNCKLGCEKLLGGVSEDACPDDCSSTCQSQCTDFFAGGCSVERIASPCRATCRRRECRTGCNQDLSTILTFDDLSFLNDDDVVPHPTLPPVLVPMVNTLYRVDMTEVLPTLSSRLAPQLAPNSIGYSTVVIMVMGQAATKYYVLDDSNEIDLGDFTCQTVNVSFAIATAGANVSNFSPSLTLDVIPTIEAEPFPSQLTPEAITVVSAMDERVGYFRQHIVYVSWELPADDQLAVGYTLTLESEIQSCGRTTVNIDNATVTNYTFQLSAPNTEDTAMPPVSGCPYMLLVEVNPRNTLGGDVAAVKNIITNQYDVPSSNNISMSCEEAFLVEDTGAYNITLRLDLDSAFTPAIIDVINSVEIQRFRSDMAGIIEIPTLIVVRNATQVTVNQTILHNEIIPTEAGEQFYVYIFRIIWRTDIPRSKDPINSVSTECVTSALEFGRPPPVNASNIMITTLETEALLLNEYRVDIHYSFTYPHCDICELPLRFEIWFGRTEAPEDISEVRVIGVLTRSSSIEDVDVQTTEDFFALYFQIRVVSANFVSNWSQPIVRNVSIETTRPEVVTDEEFDITSFTYSTSPDGIGGLTVQVSVELSHIISETVDVQVCVSTEELPPDAPECQTGGTFKATESDGAESLSLSVQLESLGVPVYIQVRAVNLGNLEGNWSNAEVLDIADIPPPAAITIQTPVLELATDSNGDQFFSVTVGVEWEGPASTDTMQRKKREPVRETEMEISSYMVAIGVEEIEPFGEVPETTSVETSSVTASTMADASLSIPLDDVDNSTTNLTLYIQLRSVSEGASGSWSEAVIISVNLTDLNEEPESSLGLVIGISIPIGLIAGVLLFLIVALVVFLVYKQYKIRHGLKGDGGRGAKFNLWSDNYPDMPYIPPGLVEGKELVVDEWEIPTTDVIVEDHLGEGAFGLVFKGVVCGPLRNPNLSSKVRQAIALPVAIKLLKDTASNKEKSDFWIEIDMMKKISSGFCANVVNMIGCVTLQEPLCLITEFVPHGDLLDYLRNQRKKNNSRKREEKYLRVQLEQQRKAYEDMKKQMEILQSAQSDAPGEGRLIMPGSGYADLPGANDTPVPTTDAPKMPGSGYADLSGVNDTPVPTTDAPQTPLTADLASPITPSDVSSTAPLLRQVVTTPYADMGARGGVISPAEGEESVEKAGPEGRANEVGGATNPMFDKSGPEPYEDPVHGYSNLEPRPQEADEDEDIYGDIGDLDGNDLMQFAYQIATGMEYLASINIVHRDLACRNILVGEGKNLKITDFGLSRQVEDVYVKTTKGRLPLKWMALESVEAREFTTSSDVWSYGIVLWEIGTMGGFPYPTIQNQDLLMMLKQGYRLEKPDNCASEVYEIMLECWQEHPTDRPDFSQLRSKFSSLLLATTDDTYMELQVDEAKVYYTMGEEEEKQQRRDSVSSCDSSSSNKQKEKKIEKPKWAQNANAYVTTPSTFKDDHVHVVDEHYRVKVDVTQSLDTKDPVPDQAGPASSNEIAPEASNGQAPPSVHNPLAAPVFLEEQAGIPLSFISGEKPVQPPHQAVQKKQSNPYVDDPATKQLLPDEEPSTKIAGSLAAEDPGHRSKLGSLAAELNTRLRAIGEEEHVTSM